MPPAAEVTPMDIRILNQADRSAHVGHDWTNGGPDTQMSDCSRVDYNGGSWSKDSCMMRRIDRKGPIDDEPPAAP
jgi:hypothetical protein